MMKWIKFRIVTDNYSGYEAQIWRWYWPFWVQIGGINTWRSIEDAKAFIARRYFRAVKVWDSQNETK